jgi:hypothetical protein
MPTFIVRFMGDAAESFRGRVRHVASGEEAVFTSVAELAAFLEGMNVASGFSAEAAGCPGGPPRRPARAPAAERPRPRSRRREDDLSGESRQ